MSSRSSLGPIVAAATVLLGGAVAVAAGRRKPAKAKAVGYKAGEPFDIVVTYIHGKPVELATAAAFRAMAKAAAAAGARIKVVSGFRTMKEQEYLYDCYLTKSCNNGNLAAKPGFSNHQSGSALDLNTKDPAVGSWIKAHGNDFGFYNTVPGEPWHWEYQP